MVSEYSDTVKQSEKDQGKQVGFGVAFRGGWGQRIALVLCFAVFGVLVGVLPNWNCWGVELGLHEWTDQAKFYSIARSWFSAGRLIGFE